MMRMTLLRESKGWSKSELSRQARMTPSDVGRIELGRTKPYPSQLAKIAAALGVEEAAAASILDPVIRGSAVAADCCCSCHIKE